MAENWKQLRRPRYWLWVAVLVLLLWVFQTVSWAEVGRVLSRLTPGQILVLIMANGLVLIGMSGRWWLVLRAQSYGIPYFTLAGYRLASFGVSYFTPGPHFGGEPLQVYLVRQHHRVPGSTAIAAVTVDKLLELLVNFTFLVAGLMIVLQRQIFPDLVSSLMVTLGLSMLALPAVALIELGRGRAPFSTVLPVTDRIMVKWSGRQTSPRLAAYQRVTALIRTSEAQATHFCQRYPKTLALALWVSLLTWGLLVAEYWLALHFLGASLTPVQTIIALTAARVAILMPLPGGLGTLEASQVLAMQMLGLDPAIGLSLALLIRARDLTLGGLGLWWGGVKS